VSSLLSEANHSFSAVYFPAQLYHQFQLKTPPIQKIQPAKGIPTATSITPDKFLFNTRLWQKYLVTRDGNVGNYQLWGAAKVVRR